MQESYLSLAHPEDDRRCQKWWPAYQISFTISQKQTSSTSVGQASEKYLSGPTVRPNTSSLHQGRYSNRSRAAAQRRRTPNQEGNPIEIGKEGGAFENGIRSFGYQAHCESNGHLSHHGQKHGRHGQNRAKARNGCRFLSSRRCCADTAKFCHPEDEIGLAFCSLRICRTSDLTRSATPP